MSLFGGSFDPHPVSPAVHGVSPLQSTFEIVERHGIWRVTLDGIFFGDYRSQANALDGLGDARRALTAAGRVVSVVAPASEG